MRFASHHEFHVGLADHRKAKPFVKSTGRIVFQHAEHDRLSCSLPFLKEQPHHLCPDPTSLKGWGDVELLEENLRTRIARLQPSHIAAIKRDDLRVGGGPEL